MKRIQRNGVGDALPAVSTPSHRRVRMAAGWAGLQAGLQAGWKMESPEVGWLDARSIAPQKQSSPQTGVPMESPEPWYAECFCASVLCCCAAALLRSARACRW
uniref:Uncharacterized protein n=1 Tax=Cryptomonas curvata TaxID=233186 RepID=A0A7S0MIN4_9CRYP